MDKAFKQGISGYMPWYWAPNEIACINDHAGTGYTITPSSELFIHLSEYDLKK
jgi:hypothetical protein